LIEEQPEVNGALAVNVPKQFSFAMQNVPIFAVALPQNMTAAQRDVEMNFRILYQASVNLESSDINQLLLNLELLAFGFSWFARVCAVYLTC
jgi:hypothetical protein